jgi:hypothetical protein
VHASPGREQRLAAAFLRLLDAYEKGTDAGASDRPDWVRDAVHDANGVLGGPIGAPVEVPKNG